MAAGMHRRGEIGDAKLRTAMETLERVPTTEPVALAACVGCHEQQFAEYRDSVHGRASLSGNADVPTCTDCHGEHYTRAADDLQSSVHPSAVVNTCAACHAAEGIVGKYGVPTEQYYTYRESYHGIANQYGSTTVANCASCHMEHDVWPSSDPRSSVHPDNLPRTCGECHRWSNPNVARGKIHVLVTPEREPLLYYVRAGFKWLTIVVMAALCGHIALDLFRRAVSWGRE
jgi:cytochrome c553